LPRFQMSIYCLHHKSYVTKLHVLPSFSVNTHQIEGYFSNSTKIVLLVDDIQRVLRRV
jgi:hypothetical protein